MRILLCAALSGLIFSQCTGSREKIAFELLPEDRTGINFNNALAISDTFNGLTFEYIYNGGGVAVGDVNNDGLPDLFFTGNMVSSRLYLNKGDMTFQDVTEAAGVSTTKWCTGVSMTDINDDGWTDIYICVAGPDSTNRQNIFFINHGTDDQGVPRFTDMAEEIGLADNGYSTMAVFLDYDKDLDMDMFILTNAMEGSARSMIRPVRVDGSGPSTDRLYRNDGQGKFTNVSKEAGMTIEGYGLGVAVADMNLDGWPDIYCADDFLSNDLLYINNQNGTFTERSGDYFSHFTHNGMGMDIADVNNDGLSDVFVLDMLPPDNPRQKLMIASNRMAFSQSVSSGYHPQFLRNTLQLNRGMGHDGKPLFSEIAFLAGIHQTDWSWAPLFADIDNDGWKDLLVTNGFRKDVTNLDYAAKLREMSRFGTWESNRELVMSAMADLPDVKLNNFVFRNNHDLTFSDYTRNWGLDVPTFSNGAALADLDNDGDLDLVVNNIDQPARIFENHVPANGKGFLKIRFGNTISPALQYGAKVTLFHGGNLQYAEYYPFRGYKSTISDELHFGLGDDKKIDSLTVLLPDGRMGVFHGLGSDTTLVLSMHSFATKQNEKSVKSPEVALMLSDVTSEVMGVVKHLPAAANDFTVTPTLLHSLSHGGPGLALADVNGDGIQDLYISGDHNTPGTLLMGQADGRFCEEPFPSVSQKHEAACIFFDADNDGDQDLYVVSGGYKWPDGHQNYSDCLYLNDGKGHFSLAQGVLPSLSSPGSCVAAADWDGDGDIDLFRGARTEGKNYPSPGRSVLLRNDGGRFVDVTNELGLQDGRVGLVTSAVWTKINSDDMPDLVVVGEWMAPRVWINKSGKLTEPDNGFIPSSMEGWWTHVHAADLDGDGDDDFILGNFGLNSFFKASASKPLQIHTTDLDRNGRNDPIVTQFNGSSSYIVHPFMVFAELVPGIKSRFKTHSEYGNATFDASFTVEEKSGMTTLNCHMMESVILENDGGKALKIHALPMEVQFAPVFAAYAGDLNGDGLNDLVLVGNSHHGETISGYYDASFGNVLINKGGFAWKAVPTTDSGLLANGDKRAIMPVVLGDGRKSLIISENDGTLKAYILPENEGLNSKTKLNK